jgi:hypothetical protein
VVFLINDFIKIAIFSTVDESQDSAKDQVAHALGTITAWYVAAGQVFTMKALHKEIKLHRLVYRSFNQYNFPPESTEQKLRAHFTKYNFLKENTRNLINRTSQAKVHAEAALMVWAYNRSRSGDSYLVSST